MFKDEDADGLEKNSGKGAPIMSKKERDDPTSRAHSVAVKLMNEEPNLQLTMGIQLSSNGQVKSDVSSIASRHVDNQATLKKYKNTISELDAGDMFTVLVPVNALRNEKNPTKRFVGSKPLDLLKDFRKLKKKDVISYGLFRAKAGLFAAGDERVLHKVSAAYMDLYLKDSVDRDFDLEPERDQCALLYVWLMLKKILFIDEKTVTLLTDWMEEVGTKGSSEYFGGNIGMLNEAYIAVCKCLLKVNRLPKKAYVWLLKALSTSKWEPISEPYGTKLKLHQVKTVLEEVELSVPEKEQKEIYKKVEVLTIESSRMFENKISSQEIKLDKTQAGMNSFGRGGDRKKIHDGLKSSDPIFDGVKVELIHYDKEAYKKLDAKQKQLLRIKRIEAGLDPRTGKKQTGNYNRKKGWNAEGSANHAGGMSGVKIEQGKVILTCKNCGQQSGSGAHTTKYCWMAKKNPQSFPEALPPTHPYYAMLAKVTPVANSGGGGGSGNEESGSISALSAQMAGLTAALSKMATVQEQVASFEAKDTESPERARQYEQLSKGWSALK